MADNGHADMIYQPDPDAWNQFLRDNEEDLLPTITRMDSSEVVYDEQLPQAKFFGKKYLKGELMGEGSYSKVKEALDIETLCRRAVKIVKLRAIRKIPNGYANVKREIKTLKRLKHRNIISLIEEFFIEEKQKLYIILEYCCCDLQVMLDMGPAKFFPEWQAHYFFTQLIDGLEYLHSRGIIHKDIKPGNLLLTLDHVLKITDFGVSEELDTFAKDDTITQHQGSPVIQAPEVADGADSFSGFKTDIWSCGVTLYRMCTEKYPFEGATVFQLFDNIAKAELVIPEHVSDHLKTLLKGMLTKEAEKRYSISAIKSTVWFTEQKLKDGEAVLMPAPSNNTAFTMTTLESLGVLVTGIVDIDSEDEIVLGATSYEPLPNNSENNQPQIEANHTNHNDMPTTHRKHKKNLKNKCTLF